MKFGELKKLAKKREVVSDKYNRDVFDHFDRWPIYRYDAWSYFELFPEIGEFFKEYFARHKGEKISHLDIAGSANFNEEEKLVDTTYAIERASKKPNNPNILEADVMDDKSFEDAVQKIKDAGDVLDLVTFEPVGGMDNYNPYDISRTNESKNIDKLEVEYLLLKVLLKRLKTVSSVMKVGGLLYLGESYLLNEYFSSAEDLMIEFFEHAGFRVVYKSIKGEYYSANVFLLEKIKNNK